MIEKGDYVWVVRKVEETVNRKTKISTTRIPARVTRVANGTAWVHIYGRPHHFSRKEDTYGLYLEAHPVGNLEPRDPIKGDPMEL